MRLPFPRCLPAAAGLFAALLSAGVSAQQVPAGWVHLPDPAPGISSFAPAQLSAREHLAVNFYPRTTLDDQPIDRWLADAAGRDAPPPGGAWTGALKVSAQTANTATASRSYRDSSGSAGFALYMALTVDKVYGRIGRWHASSEELASRHKAAASALMGQLAATEMSSAKAEHRGIAVEAGPPRVDGVKPGGTFAAGRYVGNLLTSKGEVLRKIEVLLFANGEYLFPAKYKLDEKKGRYLYEPATGKLNVTDILYNSRYDEGDFCVYGRDAQGAPVIYAQDEYGVGTHSVMLRRVGDVGQLPPTQAAAAEKAAQEEAKRYKYVTEPGRGIAAQEIEAVVYSWRLVYEGAGSRMDYEAYLLLKDGTAHDGVPVPPQDMDLSLSRRREPEKWGRWRKEGNGYAFAWPDKPQEWKKVQGGAMQPGQRGMTLQGEWTASSSSSVPMGTSTWNRWGVKLQSDGRFEKSQAGGMYAAGAPGTEVVTSTTYDNDGAVTSTSAPGVAIGVQRKNSNQGNKSGRYEIDGYAITLRYDNGTVERQPFFIDGSRKSIWFDGSMLTR